MKLTISRQKQLDEAYETLIQVCLYDRPLEDMAPILAEDVMNFGAGGKEITKTKKAFLQQIKGQKKLAAGLKMKFKFKPVLRKITSQGNGAIYTDDIINSVWINGVKTDLKFRLSFIFEYRDNKWMLVHSHTSAPDSQRTDDEVWPVEELKKRTEVLEKSLDEKIAELEIKNRELEIEAALERVRAQAMSMQKPEDLAAVSEIVFTELMALGFSKLRNTEIIINKDEKESILSYYYSDYGITGTIEVSYNQNPVLQNWATEMKQASNAFVAITIPENEMDAWRQYREEIGYMPDPKLNEAKTVFYYSYSIGLGALSVSTWEPVNEDQLKTLERFRNVFGLAYRRYADVEQAEAQAREAQLEAALERVRARTMAMNKSDELEDVADLLFQQIEVLGVTLWNCGFNIWDEDKKYATSYNGHKNRVAKPFKTNSSEDVFLHFYEAEQRGESLYVEEIGGEACAHHYKYMTTLPGVGELVKEYAAAGVVFPTFQIFHIAFFAQGYLMFITLEPVPRLWDVFKRFAKVFEQTYTRFLDLQTAEAQTREAKIEAALERTRTQSMLMQHSEQLDDTLRIFHEQVLLLDIKSAFSFLWLPDEKNERHIFWAAWAENDSNGPLVNSGLVFKSKAIDYPLDRNEPATVQCLVDWKGKEPVVSYHVPPNGVAPYFAAWQELIAGVEQLKPEYFSDGLYYVEAFMKYGCFGVMVRNELSTEEKKILFRFAIEFERTYTRFLGLQKAEANAREARIEVSLERIRSRAMAMRNTEELFDAADLVGKELTALGIESMNVSYAFLTEDERSALYYSVNPVDGKIIPFPFVFPHTETDVMVSILSSWKNQEAVNIQELDEVATLNHQTWIGHHIRDLFEKKGIAFSIEEFLKISPKKAVISTFNFANGYLFSIGSALLSESQKDILLRVTKVFEMTYRRFLDLQKAEAQAKEGQIELALERVRARTMAMQKSDELKEVIKVVYDQFVHLHFQIEHAGFVINYAPKGDWNFWVADQHAVPSRVSVPYFESVWGKGFIEAKENKQDFFATLLDFEEKNKFYQELLGYISGLPEETLKFYFSCPGLAVSTVVFDNVSLYIENFSGISYSDVENATLMRFGKVFQQTYTRFLDLQKSEAQAREGQVQLAMERVRARTMAMQRSEELPDTASLLFKQLQILSIPLFTCSFNIWDDDKSASTCWGAREDGLAPPFKTSSKEDVFIQIYEAAQRGESLFVKEQGGEELETHYQYLVTIPEVKIIADDLLQAGLSWPTHQIIHCAFFSQGYLLFISYEPVPEAHDLFRRFAKVFEQTYTRFLDLQKAESQARESQIEAALERVRARTMAMQRSDELKDAAVLLFQQVQAVGVHPYACGFNIWDDDEKAATAYMSRGNAIQPEFTYSTSEDVFAQIHTAAKNGESLFVKEQQGEELQAHYQYLATIPVFKKVRGEAPIPPFQIIHGAFFSQGYLMFITFEPVPSAHDVFKRFAKVFEQTYTRFLDLQKSEALAVETIKQASVDRVRAEIASMRSTSDLERITPLIWNELTTLGVPFIRCGVFIMDELEEQVHTFLSTPDGHALAAFHQPFNAPGEITDIVKSWQKREMYRHHWDEARFNEFTKGLVEQGAITSGEKYITENHPTDLYLHFLPFLQGMLYAGNTAPLSDDELQLVQNLADAFSTAYARYEDFNKLEAAKEQVDRTLTDLKQAQSQLVQAEKMASLGELTAGIAHEIQNPLNFVNNFSELSNELIGEMEEEMDKGNRNEAKQIAEDIRSNLEKINLHGKRADAIVKGMLQHSRTSSGEKQPVDINALADEYLRLAYHGLRAKDKSFNAALVTDFDQEITKVNINPQDIGRVLLNLISNAFYAVDEKKKSGNENFEPTVAVNTKKVNSGVEITVKDNGNGIPQKVLDKIFQPFFTTKPTGQGTGLGLSLAYDIVKAHGGEIKVETTNGQGSSFIINIPLN